MARAPEKIRVPLIFKLLLPLILGVILAFYCPIVVSGKLMIFILLGLAILTFPVVSRPFFARHLFGFISSLFFFFLGIYLTNIQTSRLHSSYFQQTVATENSNFQIRLITEPETKTNSMKCFAEVRTKDGVKKMGKTLLYFQKTDRSQKLRYGDVIYVNTRFNEVQSNGNPKEFDYARYLRIQDVVHQAYIKDDSWQLIDYQPDMFFSWVYSVRRKLDDLLDKSKLEGANLSVAKALILGEKASLDRETLRSYSSAGAMHVLAVSGLHVGIVMLIFSVFLKPIKRLPKGTLIYVGVILLIIWFYALITGMSSSVLRATFMFSFVIIGKELERETSVYQSIMVSAFLLILIEPLVLFQVGFQLSYLAVLGIVYLQPKIYNLFYTKYVLPDKIWQITSVSVAAQIATFPLGLYYFHQFPNFFMISNLIVIPLAFVILFAGVLFFATYWIPFLGDLVLLILDLLLTILNHGVKWVENLPYSIYWGVSIHWFEAFWMYLIIAVATAAFVLRKAKLVLFALVLSCGLLIFNVWEKFAIETSNELVIYNVNKSTAIDIFYGGKNIFIADEELLADDDKLLFHVMHNWFFRSGKELPFQAVAYNPHNRLVQFGTHTLLILNNEMPLQLPMVSAIYLQNMRYIPSEILTPLTERNIPVIVGQGVGFKLTNLLIKNLGEARVHELKREGAFVLKFD